MCGLLHCWGHQKETALDACKDCNISWRRAVNISCASDTSIYVMGELYKMGVRIRVFLGTGIT